MDLSLEQFERQLARHTPATRPPDPATSRAAVAALLRFDADTPEVLLMERARVRGDRWSGHIALPGGREEPTDATLEATAVRETREEVGIDLTTTARRLGQLAPVRAVARGAALPLWITPFVFVQTRAASIHLGVEAAATLWLPLGRAAAGELDGLYPYIVGEVTRELPCWRYRDRVIWGLTYAMLVDLLAVVSARPPGARRT